VRCMTLRLLASRRGVPVPGARRRADVRTARECQADDGSRAPEVDLASSSESAFQAGRRGTHNHNTPTRVRTCVDLDSGHRHARGNAPREGPGGATSRGVSAASGSRPTHRASWLPTSLSPEVGR
jgi:hypothetical protein